MITLKTFKNILETYLGATKYTDQLCDLNFDLYESPIWSAMDIILDEWGDTILTEEGLDLLYWWLFEDVDKVIYIEEEQKIDVASIENFYNYLKDNGCLRN